MNEASALPDYAELHCLSNFSFLRGASHSRELVQRAVELGYCALAITDECSFAGVVRAHEAAKPLGLKLLIGAELILSDGLKLVLLAQNRAGYGNLSAIISLGRRRADKGKYVLSRGDLASGIPDCLALWIASGQAAIEDGFFLMDRFPGRCWIAYERHLAPDDRKRFAHLQHLARTTGIPLVASGDVHMHVRERRPLQDTLTALRLNTTVQQAGSALFPNGERHLRRREALARLYPPALLAETVRIAGLCQFSLDELRYEYPEEVVPFGQTPAGYLRQETQRGLHSRYPQGIPGRVQRQVDDELQLIGELGYEPYFLTVYDIVAHARRLGILCQGRGSAANSAVCYALRITEVDPARANLLFGRFISRERNEPPDIDVDFEHQRREEIIQYIYSKYGRERAALTATVICYRSRSALRDTGRALGIDRDKLDALTSSLAWWDKPEQWQARFADVGLDAAGPTVRLWMQLAQEIKGFPRHLSQHVGGFVISRGRLDRLVPIENAAMPERSVIQWDKDDIDVLGLMKVDVLALGMLSAIRRALAWVALQRNEAFALEHIPPEDPAVYRMISAADTIGVFQIESRAQMSMLPRLRPQTFYDLVIEVAIVRPGPIQGDMVHPYLRRRQGKEPVSYPSEAVKGVLERTLGVPLFQEQAMQLSMVAAGFAPGEADQLRRAMAAWKRRGGIGPFRDKLLQGMAARGYSRGFSEALYRQLEGFADYGFPESHAASFALLVYVSAWLKCHYPAAFLAGLLNSLPMGFYSASQLVQDAQRHGVAVRPVDVTASLWETTLEETGSARPVIRFGMNRISGMGKAAAERIVAARSEQAFTGIADLAHRAALNKRDLELLAEANALVSLAGHRREAAWETAVVRVRNDLLDGLPIREERPLLVAPGEPENLLADYATLGLTLGGHPLSFLRQQLSQRRYVKTAELRQMPSRKLARCAGFVTCRQRPSTSKGVIFVTLEDETGMANVIVHALLAERQRKELLGSRLLGVLGVLQCEGEVVHLIAKRLVDHTELLGNLHTSSRDFR
ncbi:error-prone DNA polymerase [Propionivibrio sp.]|uniref:error-prone DNA polymerase n=1 Tax=Propionivibrio sp. TaxID=2212460 RepID=UPI0025D76725|nr:error-prone DNA polymerase [Propionivibrio sp.]MBK7356671.1 error-prone DNA polymerase [Propionivibrio sp.]